MNPILNTLLTVFLNYAPEIVITNGFVKKTQKTPKAEIDLAKKYRNDFLDKGDF